MGTIKEGCLLNSCNTQCQKITISCPTPHTLSVCMYVCMYICIYVVANVGK